MGVMEKDSQFIEVMLAVVLGLASWHLLSTGAIAFLLPTVTRFFIDTGLLDWDYAVNNQVLYPLFPSPVLFINALALFVLTVVVVAVLAKIAPGILKK